MSVQVGDKVSLSGFSIYGVDVEGMTGKVHIIMKAEGTTVAVVMLEPNEKGKVDALVYPHQCKIVGWG